MQTTPWDAETEAISNGGMCEKTNVFMTKLENAEDQYVCEFVCVWAHFKVC